MRCSRQFQESFPGLRTLIATFFSNGRDVRVATALYRPPSENPFPANFRVTRAMEPTIARLFWSLEGVAGFLDMEEDIESFTKEPRWNDLTRAQTA